MSAFVQLFAVTILPVLVVAGVGFVLQRALHLDPSPLSRVAFYAALPALLFQLLVSSQINPAQLGQMMLLATGVMLGMACLGFLLSRALRLSGPLAAAFILSVTFMNAGNYGLSVSKFAFGEAGLAWASVFYVTSSMLANAAGVYIASIGRRSPLRAAAGLLKVPALYVIPLAFFVRGTGLQLPVFAARSIELLAAAAIPLMLLVLGMQLARAGIPQRRALVGLSTTLRLIVSPLLAWILIPAFSLPGVAGSIAVLESAMPSAVLNSIIAAEFDTEPGFVAGAVLMSTVLSPLTLTPILALLGA